MKYIILISFVFLISCAKGGGDKNELRSPCVAADSDSLDAPCIRRPINDRGLS